MKKKRVNRHKVVHPGQGEAVSFKQRGRVCEAMELVLFVRHFYGNFSIRECLKLRVAYQVKQDTGGLEVTVDHWRVGVVEKARPLAAPTAIFILVIHRREPFIHEGNRMFQVSFLVHIDQ